jgi:DNA adenine methylase
LIYSDPPYLRETRKNDVRLYKYDYSYAQHIELLEVLKTLPCMVMISGYESPLYKESLKSWQTHCYQAACHHGVATEWLWMNYNVSMKLHDYRYLGDNFRERERIKRKTQRWVVKLETMPILERQALLYAMDEVREQ